MREILGGLARGVEPTALALGALTDMPSAMIATSYGVGIRCGPMPLNPPAGAASGLAG